MDSTIDAEKLKTDLKALTNNHNKVTCLYLENEPNISDATKELINFFQTEVNAYLKIIEMQITAITSLEFTNKQILHNYYVEKQKNDGTFKNN
jgi:hypothetical protein